MVQKNGLSKVMCPKCNVETWHKKVWGSKDLGWNDGEGMWETIYYELIECKGCETPSLKKINVESEGDMIPTGEKNAEGIDIYEYVENIKLWPDRGYFRRKIKDFYDASPVVKRIYRETIEAFNMELPTLCAAGLRAIIESICQDEKVDGNDLKEKIDSLKTKGIISDKLCEGLQTSRLIGNTSLHDLKLIGTSDLSFGIDLIESLLDYHYNTAVRSQVLKAHLS